MSVTDLTELFDERRALRNTRGRRYIRVYHVHTDSMDDDEYKAVKAVENYDLAHIPLSKPHPSDPSAYCVEIGPAVPQNKSPFLWRVPVRWETPSGTGTSRNVRHPIPFAREWEVEWSQTTIQLPLDVEAILPTPKEVRNSAGEKFDPPIFFNETIPILRISRNEPEFNWVDAAKYAGTVNEKVFNNAKPGHAFMYSIVGRKIWDDEFDYWRVSYEIHFKWSGWNLPVLDLGFSELIDNELKVMSDNDGKDYNTPQLLNGQGKRLTEGAEPVHLDWPRYFIADFTLLNLEVGFGDSAYDTYPR